MGRMYNPKRVSYVQAKVEPGLQPLWYGVSPYVQKADTGVLLDGVRRGLRLSSWLRAPFKPEGEEMHIGQVLPAKVSSQLQVSPVRVQL